VALAFIDGDRIRLSSEWRERELCKQVPGCKWDENARGWWTTLSWSSCVALRGVFGDRLEIDQGLSDWASKEIESRVEPCLRLRQSTEPGDTVYGVDRLEPLQTVAVEFLTLARRALLGDGMGSGKTVEAICAVEEMALRYGEDHVFPCLVVCTNTMVRTWAEELEAWARPDRTIGILKGGAVTRRKIIESRPDFLVINWEALASHTNLSGYGSMRLSDKEKEPKELNAVGIKTVVADEAHRGKNPKAKQTRAWWRLSWDAENSIAASGTPYSRSPEDLWSIMHGVAPHEWPGKTAWVDRYGLKAWNPFGGLNVTGLRGDTQDEMFRFLDPRFIRRPTNVVIPNIADKLPPQIRKVELAPKQRKAYKQMREEMIAILDDGYTMASDHLVKMSRLLQLASAYLEIDESGDVRMVSPSCKVDALVDIMDELDDEPLVVFTVHRQLVDLCAAKLKKDGVSHGVITGHVGELERTQAVRRFQEGESRVVLATMGAGGEGITLTKARHVVFLQRSASLIQNRQAEDRVWRRGQDRPVQPIYVVSDNTAEERVLQIGTERDATFEEMVRDEETLRKMLDL
jgi:SNF2 family DNA or RNA helicase